MTTEASLSIIDQLAVCSWSLQPNSPEELIEKLLLTGIRRIQLHLNPLFSNPDWHHTQELLRQAEIQVVSGMLTMTDEDYSTLETIKVTGGILPDNHWHQNWTILTSGAYVANELGLDLVTFHAGFIPHTEDTESDPKLKHLYDSMLNRLKHVCKVYKRHHLKLGLETGQETANDLLMLLKAIDSDNLGVNFDPANMILYDKGDPIAALGDLRDYIYQLHVKDANSTKSPGSWGEEVTVGEGEVDWPAFWRLALDITEESPERNLQMVIEREAGEQRVTDIKQAAAYLKSFAHAENEVNA